MLLTLGCGVLAIFFDLGALFGKQGACLEVSTCILTPSIVLSMIFTIISLTKLYDLGSITGLATQSLDNLLQ